MQYIINAKAGEKKKKTKTKNWEVKVKEGEHKKEEKPGASSEILF